MKGDQLRERAPVTRLGPSYRLGLVRHWLRLWWLLTSLHRGRHSGSPDYASRMGKVHEAIDGRLREFIDAQHVFFVATAPLAGDGLINLSPRGVNGTFAVLDDHTFAWLDGTGSGTETIAHLRENGRTTVMFCAFEGAPNIVRLHGKGRVVGLYDEEYADLVAHFSELPGARAVVVVDVERISDSCGFGVPLMAYTGERDLMQRAFARKGVEGSADYRRRKNRVSLDGLPGFDDDR